MDHGRSAPDVYAAGHQAHVPAIIGWNHDERTGTLNKEMTAEKWSAYATEHSGAHANDFLKAFPGDTDEQAIHSADDMTTAQFIGLATWRWAEADAATGKVPVYRYSFDELSRRSASIQSQRPSIPRSWNIFSEPSM